ncbi:alpha/beta-hydrolase [Hortaea werneckii]|uniref:Phospholipase/carboxylesterase/thioesterase domain-containing protein n=1 Tax=Hortaea werneckii TaxID=91943 RepID=A0A3M7C9L5_HORWE|nr:alpha/beta-hydrolase [Hortaea werneckii]KAI7717227.1 alpha/beta-hydrolase [Hortaea werneckii]RMY48852.1 hypothetical protein D0865_07851 [Hortaea werneckii]
MGRLPTADDFPSNVTLSIVPPPNNDPPTNVLILLHGLGDTHVSFEKLGKQMNLPETACISIRGPQGLLDMGGFHWGDDVIFESTSGGLDADGGFKQATAMLKGLVEDDLMVKCGYSAREIMLFGFGQGGMAALNLTVALSQQPENASNAELGGSISIGAPLASEAPPALIAKCKTPILVCAGNDETSVTSTAEGKLKRIFEYVEIKRYRRAGDVMPNSRDEMMPIMQFFARRLRSTKGVPEGAVEVGK